MACLFAILGIFFPRFVLLVLAITTDYLSSAFQTFFWPALGFLFAPFTTLAYAFAMHGGGLTGWRLAVFIIAILLDLGVIGGSRPRKTNRDRKKC